MRKPDRWNPLTALAYSLKWLALKLVNGWRREDKR